jgi:hypothetical protein
MQAKLDSSASCIAVGGVGKPYQEELITAAEWSWGAPRRQRSAQRWRLAALAPHPAIGIPCWAAHELGPGEEQPRHELCGSQFAVYAR